MRNGRSRPHVRRRPTVSVAAAALRCHAQRHAGTCRQEPACRVTCPEGGSHSDPQPGLRQPVIRAATTAERCGGSGWTEPALWAQGFSEGGAGVVPALSSPASLASPPTSVSGRALPVHTGGLRPHSPRCLGWEHPNELAVEMALVVAAPGQSSAGSLLSAPCCRAGVVHVALAADALPEGQRRGVTPGVAAARSGNGVCRRKLEPDDPSGPRCG